MMHSGKADGFVRRNLEHAASGRDRSVPECHDHGATAAQQPGKVRHRSPALLHVEMHPDRGEHDEVKAVPRLRSSARSGRLSSSHSIRGEGCSAMAGRRKASVGSTATTR